MIETVPASSQYVWRRNFHGSRARSDCLAVGKWICGEVIYWPSFSASSRCPQWTSSSWRGRRRRWTACWTGKMLTYMVKLRWTVVMSQWRLLPARLLTCCSCISLNHGIISRIYPFTVCFAKTQNVKLFVAFEWQDHQDLRRLGWSVLKRQFSPNVHIPIYVPGVSLAVLVPRVPDDLPGQGKELVPPGEHGRGQTADLGGRLVHRHLTRLKRQLSNRKVISQFANSQLESGR